MLYKTLAKMLARQLRIKLTKVPRAVPTAEVALRKAGGAGSFLKVLLEYDLRVVRQSRKVIAELSARGARRFSVYGVGGVAEIIYDLTFGSPVKIGAIYDDGAEGRFLGFNVLPTETCAHGGDIVVIASFFSIEDKVARLVGLGVARERIVTLR